MALPIERFKNSYSNWRYNPFTDTYMAVDKVEDNLYIPTSSPYLVQLLELPMKNTPSTVTVWCYDTSSYFTEVTVSPAQSQFRVDYPVPDGKGTGLLEFNSNDAGKRLKITYKATGSPVLEEFLNTKISWPEGSPADRQIVAYIASAQQFAWRNNPIRMFHEGNVVYHSSGENESCVLFRFKKSSAESKILLELKGAKLHQAYYTELQSHYHDKGSISASQPSHSHGAGTLSGTQPSHQHSFIAQSGVNQMSTSLAGDDAVTISGSVGAAGDDAITISGNTGASGVAAKTYPNALKVYIDGVDKTSQILLKAGLAALGDGTSQHTFVTNGTGEMDITDLITSDGFHTIMITEPQIAGGRVLIHLEMY